MGVTVKPALRGYSHAAGAVLAVAATLVLVVLTRNDPPKAISMLIYGASMVILLGMSAVYHVFNWRPSVRSVLRRVDHADIFLFIAGTYTAIAFNKQQDVVHRVVGPPGVILVGEGNPGRVKALLTSERRRHERVISDIPVHEIICGKGEGQIPLPKLARHIQKMKRQAKPAEITDVLARLKAIDASRPAIPMPKGPVPTSMKGMRGNFRGR
jgi:hypothetical protein